MLYVYAAVSLGAMPAPLRGVDGETIWLLDSGQVGLAVSAHDAEVAPTRERLLQHYRVNMALLGVPFRFGNAAADETELRRLMAARTEDLARQLDKLAGCVELTVTVRAPAACPSTPGPEPGPGRAYLLAKGALYRRGADVRAKSEGILRDYREELRDGSLRLACLMEADRVGAFRERLQGDGQLEVSRPWPPSSFV